AIRFHQLDAVTSDTVNCPDMHTVGTDNFHFFLYGFKTSHLESPVWSMSETLAMPPDTYEQAAQITRSPAAGGYINPDRPSPGTWPPQVAARPWDFPTGASQGAGSANRGRSRSRPS